MAEAQIALALDLGGTKLLIGEVDGTGAVLRSRTFPSPIMNSMQTPVVLPAVLACLETYREQYDLKPGRDYCAVGMGMVGRVDPDTGLWLEIGDDGPTAAAAAALSSLCGVPARIDNDSRCGLRAECAFGAGAGCRNLIYINVGTGISAGFLINGTLLTGSHFFGGEIGHTVPDLRSDALCTCGRHGCVEALASGIGLHSRAAQLRGTYPGTLLPLPPEGARYSAADIFSLADADALCGRLTQEAAQALSGTIANLIAFADPEKIILGGGILRSEAFFQRVLAGIPERASRFLPGGIVRSSFDCGQVGLIGAGALAFSPPGCTEPRRV